MGPLGQSGVHPERLQCELPFYPSDLIGWMVFEADLRNREPNKHIELQPRARKKGLMEDN